MEIHGKVMIALMENTNIIIGDHAFFPVGILVQLLQCIGILQRGYHDQVIDTIINMDL
jgi:hypothetical protein